MISSLLVVTLLSQSYIRSRVDDSNASSQCLWWLENTTITYHQNSDGNDETPGDTEFVAINKSFSTWQAQHNVCGNLTFQEGARTSSRSVGYVTSGTNENIVLFRQKTCSTTVSISDPCWKNDDCGNVYDCWQFSSSAIAITTTSYDKNTGRILDSDIEFNTPNFIFSTVDAPVCLSGHYSTGCVATDVQNTATHEVGHLQGLAHLNVATSTMSPRADPGELTKRLLDSGSKQFVCDVYPKGKPTKTCFTPQVTSTLGKPAGCTSAPGAGGLWFFALLLFTRRRVR